MGELRSAAPSDDDRVNVSPNVLMIFPKFNPNSFWSLQAACDIQGAKCTAPPLGLITVAALLPKAWNIRLINRNSEELRDSDLDWADMVMTGGMLPQADDALALIERCHRRGKIVVLGGPDVMSRPDAYAHAEFRVLGEAEGLIDRFIDAWSAGQRSGTFEGEKFQADVTKSPVPRYDLLKMNDYLYIGLQFSRGCPFTCEFCDIIELYGRVPRAKTNAQVLAELEAIYQTGYRGHVDFVDDNLIGNKKALRLLLPEIIKWQKERGYPFLLSTEASLNLADDSALLALMSEANFFAMFVGIESPETDTLVAMSKKQNTKRSIADSIAKIYGAGIFVTAGFIVGFDSERGRVDRALVDCITDTRIPVATVGLLTALPNTQLTRRLEKEGRLLPWRPGAGDQCTAGLNFITKRPRREVLEDYRKIIASIYDIDAFFDRVKAAGRMLDRSRAPSKWFYSKREIVALARLLWRLAFQRPDIGRRFLSAWIHTVRHNTDGIEHLVRMSSVYFHLGDFSKFLVADLDQRIAETPIEEQLQLSA